MAIGSLEADLREQLQTFSYAGSAHRVGDGQGPRKRLLPHHIDALVEHLLPWLTERCGLINEEDEEERGYEGPLHPEPGRGNF